MDQATATTHLNTWLAAQTAVGAGQSYTISSAGGSRTLTRVDATEIRNWISYWQRVVQGYQARAAGASDGSIRVVKWVF